jgi:hypothetical protein
MEALQLTLGGIVLAAYLLYRAARRYPHVGWLQPFADAFPNLPARRPRQTPRQFESFEGYVSAGMPPIASREPRPSAVDRTRDEMLARGQRRRGIYTGIQFILMGLTLPLAYVAVDMMLWSTMTRTEWLVVSAASLLCIGLGIAAIITTRRR